MKYEELKKDIQKCLQRYKVRETKIKGKKYPLFIYKEEPRGNFYEGFLFVKTESQSEFNTLKKSDPYKEGRAYCERIIILLQYDKIIIRDTLNNKHIIKTLKKINKDFINKLEKVLTQPTEESLAKLFNRRDVVDEFYILFKKSREFLLKNISGITEEEKREEFVDNFMMQMLTLWYLQEKGFFNNDKNYFITKFKELKQGELFSDESKNYYDFLVYFFDKISGYTDKQFIDDDPKIGKVVVTGPAVFLNGEINKAISIPDKCFYQEDMTEILINTHPKKVSRDVPLLNLFESRDWVEGDITEYVLGSLYEKLMTEDNRKKTGSYYTPDEITLYICKNTIEPYIVDRINDELGENFETIDQIIESNDKKFLRHLFEQLEKIKILDPAVGSAHFLESAIEVLVEIYRKVWEKARDLGIKSGLVIKTTDEKGNIKKRDLLSISDEENFKLLVKFFIILSKNIYGVDINPSALKVARARLFLTLAKHFNSAKSRNIFIRFPNVHFNLREGNSLIGYVRLDESGVKWVMSDIFEKIKIPTYRERKIKEQLVKISKEYLRNAAKNLELKGDIIQQVEYLEEILINKEKLSWQDFKKVLEIKADLIKILIASLNSQHAKPLNDLLGEITNLFHKKLDEKFAEEHNINLEDLRKIKTFHWFFEFPEVFMDRGGFDVVVGNPPYIMEVRDNKELFRVYKESPLGKKYYEQKMDVFYFFIERGIELLRKNGLFGYIVQEYWLTREHAKKVKDFAFTNTTPLEFILFKEFKVFKGAPGQHNMILILKNSNPNPNTEVKIKILKNVLDEGTVYGSMYNAKSNDVFQVFESPLDTLYNPQTSTVTLVGGVDEEIWNKIHEDAIFLKNKEVQQGVVTPQHFVTKKHIEKSGRYDLEEGKGIFVLSDEEYKSFNWTPAEKGILKPFHFAEEFDKYLYPIKNKHWLIYTNKEALFEIKKHPEKYINIISHLDKFKDIITSDHKPYGLHRARQPEWFESKEKIIGIRKTKYPKFAVVPITTYTDQATIIIRLLYTKVEAYYLVALFNSSLGHWVFSKLKTQGNQLQIDKGVISKFPIRTSEDFYRPISAISKYLHFLKQYQNYFAKDDSHLKYIIDYFDNLIDCLVYELYLGDVVKVPIREYAEDKLVDIELPENQLEESEKRREELFKKIESVFEKLEKDKKLNENLYLIKLHPWVKAIYKSLGR